MKSAIFVLLLALSLKNFAVAEVELPWQRPQEAELGGMEDDEGYNFGQENPGDQAYGYMEKNTQQEIDYSTETISAAMQSLRTVNISVYSLTSGAVEAVYQSPDKGRVSLNLYNDREDILIHVDARFDWYRSKNTLVLNSKRARRGQGIRPEGFPFPCCGYITMITLRVEIRNDYFLVSANGIPIAEYPFRRRLRPPVDVIEYYFEDADASMKAKLKSLTVEY